MCQMNGSLATNGGGVPQEREASSSEPMEKLLVWLRMPALAPPPVKESVRVIGVVPVAMHSMVMEKMRPGPVSSVPERSTESTRKEPSESGRASLLSNTIVVPEEKWSTSEESLAVTRRTAGS